MKDFDENIYIPYGEAKQLNGLGYDLHFEYYKDFNEVLYDMRTPYDAPCILWQNAFKWFREEHNLTSHIHWAVGGSWDFTIEKSIPRGLLDMSPTRYRVNI